MLFQHNMSLTYEDVNILTLFKKMLRKGQMSMQKVRMKKCLFHSTCGNNHDGVISILCMYISISSSLLLFNFMDHKLYKLM